MASHEFRARFSVLLNKIAEKLDDENVTTIAVIRQVPSSVKKTKQASSCFDYLHAHGEFSWEDTDPLKKLLRDIQRNDLVINLVEEYETMRDEELKIGEHELFVCTLQYPLSSGRLTLGISGVVCKMGDFSYLAQRVMCSVAFVCV